MHSQMDKTKEELINELNVLQQKLNVIESSYTDDIHNKKLLEREENYRYLFDNNPQPMWIYDIESLRFLEINNAAIHHYGYSREEFLGMTLKDIRPKEDLEALQKDIALTHRPYNLAGEWRHLKKNGEIIFVEIISHAITVNNRKARHVMVSDITERKQAEGKLRESEYRYRKIYEDGANGMVMVGKDFKFRMANRTFCQMVGYKEEELQQLTFVDITHPDDMAKDIPNVKKLIAGEIDVFRTEKRLLNKDGKTIWVQLTVSSFYDPNGQFLYNLGIIFNITDRKKAEEILIENLALIKIAGEKAKLGGWNVNIGENRVYWSDEVAAIHERPSGYAPSVEEGINFYAPEWRSKIKKVFANCVGRGIPFDEEMQIITASGKRVWVNTIGEAIRDDKGKIVKVQGAFQDISERKSTEESLRQSEENLAITLNSIGDGVIATDLNGLVVKMNPVAEKLCGWTLTDAAGKPLTEVFKIVNTNSRETAINPVKKVLENGEIVGLANSTLLISKNGTEYQISDSAAPIKNKEGKISGVVLVFSDVTEKYLTAQALKENEERLNLFFNQSLTGFFFMKLEEPIAWNDSVDKEKTLDDVFGNLRVAKVNQAMLNQYLATEDEFLNRTFNEFFAHDLKQGYKVIKELFDRGSLHIDTSELRFDGTQMWVEGDYICLYDSKGSIKGLFGTQHDITERKQAEEQLRKLSRAVEQSPASIILTDTQGNIVYVNPKTLEVTGYELSELLGKNPKIFSAGEKLKEAYNILWQKITSGKEWRGEFHNKKKNGELFWEQASISPILDEKGQITHYLAVKEDITERKQLIEDLIIAKEQAEQSDKLKSAFLANMSHEIRTPMNGILGFTEFLKEPNLSGEKQQKYINIIQKSGTRMLNIINDIVDISKIEAGLMEVDFKELNIAEPIKYIHTFFKPEFEKKGLQFFVKNNINEKEIIIKTDREKIYAILINLIKNAIKYTNEGMIELSYDNKGDFLEFSVKDTGIGIPKDRQEAIFERFIQADISDKMARQGAGLGLSITKAYVEMLGGKIWVESEDENTIIGKKGGSTFYFTIPCNTGPIIKTNGQKTKFSKKIENKVEKLKILIAEDDEASSLYLSMLAEEINSEILMAKDGLEAVEIYKNNPDIDLILMDLQMPHLNGYEATIQIRQLNKKVVIIAQTAFALSYDKQKAVDAGCSDYISKPILKAGFSALIRKYFNKRES